MKVVVDTNVLISAFVFGGNAERVLEKVLVTGDKDLLVLGSFGTTLIVSPASFLQNQ